MYVRLIYIFALFLWCMAIPSTGFVFIRTQTCSSDFGSTTPCRPGKEPKQVYWTKRCQTYFVHVEGSNNFPEAKGERFNAKLLDAITDSFGAWSTPGCSSLKLVLGGFTCHDKVGFRPNNNILSGAGMNIIIWRENLWEHATDAIAVTTLTTDPDTGEIKDADIEMNGVHHAFADLSQSGEPFTDVRNTLTHEVGHLVGFDHETQEDSTMYPSALPGEIFKRDLSTDDITGLCQVYPLFEGQDICRPKIIEDESCIIVMEGEVKCSVLDIQTHQSNTFPIQILILLGMMIFLSFAGARQKNLLKQN